MAQKQYVTGNKPLISFDYAIKYLLKNKGNYDIIEGFISAVLGTEGYPPVKIKALLESESNKESKFMKKSVADLLVSDADGHNYIVEIEREYTDNFMHKACFNTSRLIVDSLESGQDYTSIKKVFHISLLYFNYGTMNKPLYHGKTVVREVDTQHPLDLHLMSLGGQIYDAKHVFPEYFFIFVPSFNDVINSEIDEWLYVMKHSDTLDSFKSPYMAKVAERMSTLTMTDEEMIAYLQHLKEVYGKRDSLNAAEAKGREEGEYLKAIKTARIMKNKGMPTAVIVECTDLSTDEIEKLVE